MARPSGTAISLAPMDMLKVSVLHHPGNTLFSLLLDALGAATEQVPARLRNLVRGALPAAEIELISPLRTHRMGIPDCLTPLADPDIGSALLIVAEQNPDEIARQTEQFCLRFHGHIPPAWRRMVDQPRPYALAFARVFEAVWRAYEPVWRQARPVLWRETERIGTAVVTDTLPVALAGQANHCWRLHGETLHCATSTAADTARRARRLVLTPLVSGATAASFSIEHPDRIELAYPAPGLALVLQDPAAPPPADGLTALLGAARARILRHCAHDPTMAEVAALIGATPATATHHCRQLEAAGLVERQRRGRQVRLRQTARGQAVVDLYS